MPHQNNQIPEDELLVKAIKEGDHDSFKRLYFKYFDQLIRFALYRTHSMDFSRETVQELFSRIWIKKHLLNPQKSVKAYLYKALGNLIINETSRHSFKNISIEDLKQSISASVESDRDLMIDIQAVIDRFPDKIKNVYLLCRLEGFKYKEIAEILNISEKAVEKRMSKAISILRKNFSGK